MLKKRFVFVAVVFLTVAVLITLPDTTRAERKSYNVYGSLEGTNAWASKGSAEWKEIFASAIYKINKKTGYNINPIYTSTWKEIIKKIKKGQVDFVYLITPVYVKLKHDGADVKPFMVFVIGEKPQWCLYANTKRNIKTIIDLKGKKVALGSSWLKQLNDFPSPDSDEKYFQESLTFDFVLMRQLLNRAGIKTIRDAGMSFTIDYPNYDSSLIAVDKGYIDATIASSYTVEMWRMSGQPFRNIKPISCEDKSFGAVMAVTGKVSQTALDKILASLQDILKHPDAETLKILKRLNYDTGKAGFVPVNDNDLKPFFDILSDQEKNGGVAEATEIVKALIEAAKKKEAGKK